MISRRSFLVGLGGLVTSAFIARARTHVLETRTPLLLDPGRAEETLYLYDHTGADTGNAWQVSLGPWELEPPPPPTWRQHLAQRGYSFATPADLERVWNECSLGPQDLDQPLDGFGWVDYWEHRESPSARAYWLLKELGLDCPLDAHGRKAGRIEFLDSPNPMSAWHWVELRDDLSVSLLQARLIETGHRIRVAVAND